MIDKSTLDAAIKACYGERVESTGTDGDTAYNMAIDHCVSAIRSLATTSTEPAALAPVDVQHMRSGDVKTWTQRAWEDGCDPSMRPDPKHYTDEMLEEIADLRAELASRCRAQGGNTCDEIGGSSPADAGGLTPYNSIVGEKCYRAVEVDALLAAPSASASPAAPGFVLVPVVPTPEMLQAAHAAENCGQGVAHFRGTYKAMLAASPAAAVAAPVAGSQQLPEQVGGVNLARLLRNLEETSYNEGATDLACRCSDSLTVIKGLLAAAAPAVPVPVDQDQARDAARYRWLRSRERGMAGLSDTYHQADAPPFYELKCEKDLDAAIDAAMAAPSLQQPKEGNSDA